MAWYAQVGIGNVVQQVIFVVDIYDASWCAKQYGGQWLETFENGSQRKNFAGVGYTYDAAMNAFVPPQPYPSWVLDVETAQWNPPIPYPNDGKIYKWDETTKSWVAVTEGR